MDVGFANTAAGELENYRHFYLLVRVGQHKSEFRDTEFSPSRFFQAENITQSFRDNPGKHGEGLIYTQHPYVASLLLDCPPGALKATVNLNLALISLLSTGMGFQCPTPDEQTIIRNALKRGDIVLQAFPHNAETATMTPDLLLQALQVRDEGLS